MSAADIQHLYEETRRAWKAYNDKFWLSSNAEPTPVRVMRNALFDNYTRIRDKWLFAIGYLHTDPDKHKWQ